MNVGNRERKVAPKSNLLASGHDESSDTLHYPGAATLSCDELLTNLGSRLEGLSEVEASDRLARHGLNMIHVEKERSPLKLVIENFGHPMAILLWIGGVVGWIGQMPQLAIAIWLVNVINGTFSFVQEHQAERATEALKKLLPVSVTVIRNGSEKLIDASNLVPGDVILVSEGEKISADARLLEAESLEVDQSTLTGESRSVWKSATPLGADLLKKLKAHNCERYDLPNLVFAGTAVFSGHGKALVISTGVKTEFGRIAELTQTIADEPSPLQKEMMRVTRIVTVLAVSIGVVMFALACSMPGHQVAKAFIFAMGMIVAFVPEGMLPTVTLSLALAVKRMARRHALVKRLSAVEALGCTNVICTDKTGTLTENRMTVRKLWAGEQVFSFSGDAYSSDGEITPFRRQVALEALTAVTLCNNARYSTDNNCNGDPLEIALLVAARKAGLVKEDLELIHPRLRENPFESHRKCMSTIHGSADSPHAFIKGSPPVILEQCDRLLLEGGAIPLTRKMKNAISKQIDEWASEGLRLLAVARKDLNEEALLQENGVNGTENEMVFLGLFAMLDPPRPEVRGAVEKCRSAGIRVVMITGDYEVTAEAIARKVGIIASQARVITGSQLDRTSDQELTELVSDEIIFARVNPEHKLRVVRAFQNHGLIVAVTGDGVNDAPALKKADIGIAMGIAGTDVAREAADVILLNDNFASIVDAVEEGRTVYDNIKKFAVYVFNSNMAEAVPFAVMLFSHGIVPLPLTVMQVLSIDLGTDMVPAIALGADPPAEGVMQKAPRDQKEPLLNRDLLTKALLWYGAIEAVAGMSCYFYLNWLHGWPSQTLAGEGTDVWRQATTMTLAGVVACQIAAVFCCRTQFQSIFRTKAMNNPLLLAGIGMELALLGILMYVPAMQAIFDTAPLGPRELLFVFAWPPVLVLLDELRKWYLRNSRNRTS